MECQKWKQKNERAREICLEDRLWKLYSHLRHLSFEYNVPVIHGALTNFQDWYFVKFNQKAEIELQYME